MMVTAGLAVMALVAAAVTTMNCGTVPVLLINRTGGSPVTINATIVREGRSIAELWSGSLDHGEWRVVDAPLTVDGRAHEGGIRYIVVGPDGAAVAEYYSVTYLAEFPFNNPHVFVVGEDGAAANTFGPWLFDGQRVISPAGSISWLADQTFVIVSCWGRWLATPAGVIGIALLMVFGAGLVWRRHGKSKRTV